MSPIVTLAVTAGSANAKLGRFVTTGVDQLTVPLPISSATTVAPIGLDNEASWKTVSASTVSGLPTSLTPYPLAKTTCPLCTTATAMPGMPLCCRRSCARPSVLRIAEVTQTSFVAMPGTAPGFCGAAFSGSASADSSAVPDSDAAPVADAAGEPDPDGVAS